MDKEQRMAERLKSLLWPQDLAELLVFGFITLTGAALVGGVLNQLIFGVE